MKRILLLLVITMFIGSCAQQPAAEQTVETHQISELVMEPMLYDNQIVRFEGMISHICRHSGDKMRIVQTSDDSYSILVMLGEMASQFNPEMEGNEVVLLGTMKAEVMNIGDLEEAHDHEHEGEEHGHECSSTEEAIQKLQEKGIDPDIRAYVELMGVEQK